MYFNSRGKYFGCSLVFDDDGNSFHILGPEDSKLLDDTVVRSVRCRNVLVCLV